jgi:acetolactate synthase I/II/III large subunit
MNKQQLLRPDVYGRITQKVGVCLSTWGPGATNLTTGVGNANMDRSPVSNNSSN